MNPISEDIGFFLESNNFGTVGLDIFTFAWAENEDNQFLIMESGGIDPELQESIERPGFQVLYRGKKRESALIGYNKIREVYEFLNRQFEIEINDVCYAQLNPAAPPSGIGQDTEDRFIFSMNYLTYRNPE